MVLIRGVGLSLGLVGVQILWSKVGKERVGEVLFHQDERDVEKVLE
jgi:hypothetical protein